MLGGMGLARWELGPVLELLVIGRPGEPVDLGRELGLVARSGSGRVEQIRQPIAGNRLRRWCNSFTGMGGWRHEPLAKRTPALFHQHLGPTLCCPLLALA